MSATGRTDAPVMRKIPVLLALAVLAVLHPTAAIARSGADRDHDKMPDRWEKAHGLSSKRNDAKGDPDKDGVTNVSEYNVGYEYSMAVADRTRHTSGQ